MFGQMVIRQTSDGGYIVAGQGSRDLLVLKLDSCGNIPGCIAGTSTALLNDQSAIGSDTNVTGIDSHVAPLVSSAVPVNTTATESSLCILAPSDIILSTPLDGTHFNACSLYSPSIFAWDAEAEFRSFEIQFSSDRYFSPARTIKVRIPGATTETVLQGTIWKRIFSIGSQIDWKVVGTMQDGTTRTSPIGQVFVDFSSRVENPNISPIIKNSIPGLSWENNCNTRFKVWFGNDGSFGKKTVFSFNIRNPDDNGGNFMKTLTRGQWITVRRLVGDVSGSTIYWYVESWDGLGRYARTEVISFTLTD